MGGGGAQGDPFRRGLPTLQTSLTLPELPRKTRHFMSENSVRFWRVAGSCGEVFCRLGRYGFLQRASQKQTKEWAIPSTIANCSDYKKTKGVSAETPFLVSKTAFWQPKSRINKNENCSYYKIRQTLSMFPACAYRRPRRKAGQSRRDSRKDRRRPQLRGAAQPVPKRGRKREN